jgi:hypothetical protein
VGSGEEKGKVEGEMERNEGSGKRKERTEER